MTSTMPLKSASAPGAPAVSDSLPNDRAAGPAVLHRVRALAREHGRDPFRRPARSGLRPDQRAEPGRRHADDRDPLAPRAEDPRQPHRGRARGARPSPLRAAHALRGSNRRREAHHRTVVTEPEPRTRTRHPEPAPGTEP